MTTRLTRLQWLIGIVLLLSLGLNVYLLSMMAGRSSGRWLLGMELKKRFEEVVASVPADQRDQFKQQLRGTMRELRRESLAMRAARARSISQLEAPVVDYTALSADLREVRERTETIQRLIHSRIEQSVATMPISQRKELAKVMRRNLEGGGGLDEAD